MAPESMSVTARQDTPIMRQVRAAYWSGLAAFVTWFGMGVESVLRPFQDDRRETFWPLPFLCTIVCFILVHRIQRGRSRIESIGFAVLMIASGLALLGNITLQLRIAWFEQHLAILGMVVWLVGLVCFGTGILLARALPAYAGWAVIFLEPLSVLTAVALSPIAPLLPRGAYSGNIGKGIAMGLVALALRRYWSRMLSESAR